MKKLLAFAAASLLAAGGAHAAIVTYSDAYGPDLTDWDPAKTLSVQQFDTSLGSLNSVTIDLFGSMDAEFLALNPTNDAQALTNRLMGSLRFVVPTLAPVELVLADTEVRELLGGGMLISVLSDSDSQQTVLLSNWAAFVGAGLVDVGVTAFGQSAMEGGGNLDGGALTQAYARIEVSYDYTAAGQHVPEPASLALVGLALGAAGLAARRRA